MKRIFAVLALSSLVFASCNNSSEKKEETAATDTAVAAPATEATASHGPIDPVCEMDRDTSWTEYTVYNNDTVWFCSDNCKNAFTAHPEKYADKLVKK